jgi:hypothetical protein
MALAPLGRSLLFLAAFFILHWPDRASPWALRRRRWEYLFDRCRRATPAGTVLQPSTFGALLLLAVDQFLRGRPIELQLQPRLRPAPHLPALRGRGGLDDLAALSAEQPDTPAWSAVSTGPGTARTGLQRPYILPASAAALQILAQVRLPEHAVVAEWFDLAAAVKLAMILVAIYSCAAARCPNPGGRRGCSTAAHDCSALTGSHSLALSSLAITTYLVPLAAIWPGGARSAADWLARGHRSPAGRLGDGWPTPTFPGSPALGLAAMALSVISGLAWSALQVTQQRADLPGAAS